MQTIVGKYAFEVPIFGKHIIIPELEREVCPCGNEYMSIEEGKKAIDYIVKQAVKS